MKILYAIQGTGNGHLARATEIVPLLKTMAYTDVLVSGTQADLQVPFRIDYRFTGISFIIGQSGGVDLKKTVKSLSPRKFVSDVMSLPVQRYDLVISDFEPVSAWACLVKGKICIGLSHQNAVLHPSAPRPESNDPFGKFILKNYAPSTFRYGFNFEPHGDAIFPPVIRPAVRNVHPSDHGHYTVYLPSYSDRQISIVLKKIPDIHWEVFSKHAQKEYLESNIHFSPVSFQSYTESLLNCSGLLCNAGFEGPAEAIFLGKKLCVIPMKGQYEQHCNAAFLKNMGIQVLDHFSNSAMVLHEWITNSDPLKIRFPDLTRLVLERLMTRHATPDVIPGARSDAGIST
ncbi:MAG: glycosyltransferase family protein [Prolixibacteraceae bacterium]